MAMQFIYGANSVTFTRDPAMGGVGCTRQWKNPMAQSGGENRYVYEKTALADVWELTWKAIDPTDLTNLLTFLRAVNFSANAFQFIFMDTVAQGIAWASGISWASGIAWASQTQSTVKSAYYIGPSKLEWTPYELTERDLTIQLLVLTP
ncbi:MAG: hypothetical protein PHN75_15955 [Syntrophales bacterium]|nr:hypothetical protein [Syntrophales bacterium]